MYELWESCISHGIDTSIANVDIWSCYNEDTFKKRKTAILKKISAMNIAISTRRRVNLPRLSPILRSLPAYEQYMYRDMLIFERKILNLELKQCLCCTGISLCYKFSFRTGICSECASITKREDYIPLQVKKKLSSKEKAKHLQNYLLENDMLPVWYETKDIKKINPKFHIPDQLSRLSFGEKLLIQRYSAIVPIFHMGKGQKGIKGHCCCFFQDSNTIYDELPRKKSDIIRVIRNQTEGDITVQSNFLINKKRVISALLWLKIHNVLYKDITIKEDNLDWMNGKDECDMTHVIRQATDSTNKQDSSNTPIMEFESVTVSKTQTDIQNDEIIVEGICRDSSETIVTKKELNILNELKQKVKEKSGTICEVNFPLVNEQGLSEYDHDILPNIYPWCYPGGIGGNNSLKANLPLKSYAKMMLCFGDGRFASDEFWSFYMLDMIQRKDNNSNGKWLIKNGYVGQSCKTLQELKEMIDKHDYNFIDNLRYFGSRIRGSDSFWRGKKAQLDTWIEYHIEHKHGGPNLFITLSCAENWWPDLIRLLKDRLKGTQHEKLIEEMNSPNFNISQKAIYKATTLFTVLVQEFFEVRFECWMEEVGTKKFGIDYYWARVEFAKGRGQIHIHMLAISKHKKYQDEYYRELQNKNYAKATEAIDRFADVCLGMSAEHPGDKDDTPVYTNPNIAEPEGKGDVDNFKHSLRQNIYASSDLKQDYCCLCNSCMMHECNGFCMRKYGQKQKERTCRSGCGREEHEGKCDTPGFPLAEDPYIEHDKKKDVYRYMGKRTSSRRMVQNSRYVLQSWRANCDVSILIYKSDPNNPDPDDIAKVVNYCVSYITKVNMSVKEERDHVAELIRQSEFESGDDIQDLTYICRQILNSFHGKRVISRCEAMVEILRLPLVFCSETIENLSLTNSVKIAETDSSNLLNKYRDRKDHPDKTLFEYFHLKKNTNKKANAKTIIPHAIGQTLVPTFQDCDEDDNNITVKPSYARGVLICFKPWKKKDCLDYKNDANAVDRFYKFLNSPECPKSVLLRFERSLSNKQKRYFEFVQKDHNEEEDLDDNEMNIYYNYLRMRPSSGFSFGGHTFHIDHDYDWASQNCIVSTYTIITYFLCKQLLNNLNFYFQRERNSILVVNG